MFLVLAGSKICTKKKKGSHNSPLNPQNNKDQTASCLSHQRVMTLTVLLFYYKTYWSHWSPSGVQPDVHKLVGFGFNTQLHSGSGLLSQIIFHYKSNVQNVFINYATTTFFFYFSKIDSLRDVKRFRFDQILLNPNPINSITFLLYLTLTVTGKCVCGDGSR